MKYYLTKATFYTTITSNKTISHLKAILQCDIIQEAKMYKLTTRWFARWAKKEHISDEMLLKSIKDLEDGLSTISLGSGAL